MSRDVVITGFGVVSPIGIGSAEFWDALAGGVSGVGVRPRFDEFESAHRIAGVIQDFDPKKYVQPRKALKIMCAPIQYGCAAAMMAMDYAGLAVGDADPDRAATVFGTETFFADPSEVADVFQKCTVDKDYQHDRWGEFAMREIQPLWMLKYLPNMAASHISILTDARGPSNSICQGEVSALLAIIEAADLIRRDAADVVVTGGTGSQLSLTSMLYRGTEVLSKRAHDPQHASRPFDRDRDGMVVGEGAGAIILESAEHAAARNATPLARLTGWSRGFHDPLKSGFSESLTYHYRQVLDRAGTKAERVDLINANASGTIRGDAAEALAIRETFGDTPVVAHKSNFGNLGPGTSCVELIGSIAAIEHNQVPPSINCDAVADDCPVKVNTELQEPSNQNPLNQVVKSSISATGQIAVVALGR